jgi:hypothetical protein
MRVEINSIGSFSWAQTMAFLAADEGIPTKHMANLPNQNSECKPSSRSYG